MVDLMALGYPSGMVKTARLDTATDLGGVSGAKSARLACAWVEAPLWAQTVSVYVMGAPLDAAAVMAIRHAPGDIREEDFGNGKTWSEISGWSEFLDFTTPITMTKSGSGVQAAFQHRLFCQPGMKLRVETTTPIAASDQQALAVFHFSPWPTA